MNLTISEKFTIPFGESHQVLNEARKLVKNVSVLAALTDLEDLLAQVSIFYLRVILI